MTRRIYHDLSVDVSRTPENRQPRPFGSSKDLFANPPFAFQVRYPFFIRSSHRFITIVMKNCMVYLVK